MEAQTVINHVQRIADEAEKVIEEALAVRKKWRMLFKQKRNRKKAAEEPGVSETEVVVREEKMEEEEPIIPFQSISSQRVVAEEAKVIEREEDISE